MAKEREAEALIEEQDSPNIEVGEDLPQEEGEDPQADTLSGTERGSIGSGMNTSLLDPAPVETNRIGKKNPGRIINNRWRLRMTTDPKGNPTRTLTEYIRNIIQESMRRGRGLEVLAQGGVIDRVEETTAQNMDRRKEAEEVEDTTALKIEIEMVGDTLATTDEETAQGP